MRVDNPIIRGCHEPDKRLQHKSGARMVLDAILLTVAEAPVNGGAKLPVAIFPKTWVAAGDGVLIKNLTTGFEVWLTGTIDYGVCTYKDEGMRSTKISTTKHFLFIVS